MTTRKQKQVHEKLAGVLTRIASASAKMDDVAGEILAVLKRHKVTTLGKFESVSAAAYDANGWQRGGGRPKAGETRKPVPDAVKVYMSQVRKAYKLKLKVTDYDSMYDLRQAVKAKGKRPRHDEEPRDPELQGVSVTSAPDKFNGGMFHDAILLWQRLDDADRAAFERSMERLVKRYANKADSIPQPRPGVELPAPATIQ